MKICFDTGDDGFKEWVKDMLAQLVTEETSSSSGCTDSDDSAFVDHMEPGEQLKVNGMSGRKKRCRSLH